jgi:uncharacterized protein
VKRYSARPLPPYAFVPGRTAHPRTNPAGHSFGALPDVAPSGALSTGSDLFRYGADLFNAGFFWESHEAFEVLWHAAKAGGRDEEADLLQGLIQIAAAHLKRSMGSERSAQALVARGLSRLARVPGRLEAFDVAAFAAATRAHFASTAPIPRIELES